MPNDTPLLPDCSNLGPIFGRLLRAAPLNDLGPGRADRAAARSLEKLSLAAAFAPHRIVDQEMADACMAGLWLIYDVLDRSHTISQSIDTPTGSYWHAIMHRREEDFSNSKYWFRRVGRHPVFAPLAGTCRAFVREQSAALAETDPSTKWLATVADWDPFHFVDLCAAAVGGHSIAVRLCQLAQQQECRLLFDFCYRRATGLS